MLTRYADELEGMQPWLSCAYVPEELRNTLGEYLAARGMRGSGRAAAHSCCCAAAA